MSEPQAASPDAFLAVLAKALPGDTITVSWRFKPSDPLAEVQVDSSWATWVGVVAVPLDDFCIVVDWDAKNPRLLGKRRRYFPDVSEWPDSECDYSIPVLQRSAAKPPRREPPGTPPPAPKQTAPTQATQPQQQQPSSQQRARSAAPPPTSPALGGASIVLSDAQFQQLLATKKRPHESDSESRSSDSDEERYDRQAGATIPMREVVKGLRTPKAIDDTSTAFYLHLWESGAAWAIAMRSKIAEFSCNIKSWRIKRDIDLDIALIAELVDRRLASDDPADINQLRCSFSVVARIVSNLLLTSAMAAPNASELFLAAFGKALEIGRVDFSALILVRLVPSETKPVTTQAVTQQPPATLHSESADYWKSVAEDANRQLQKERSFRSDGPRKPEFRHNRKTRNGATDFAAVRGLPCHRERNSENGKREISNNTNNGENVPSGRCGENNFGHRPWRGNGKQLGSDTQRQTEPTGAHAGASSGALCFGLCGTRGEEKMEHHNTNEQAGVDVRNGGGSGMPVFAASLPGKNENGTLTSADPCVVALGCLSNCPSGELGIDERRGAFGVPHWSSPGGHFAPSQAPRLPSSVAGDRGVLGSHGRLRENGEQHWPLPDPSPSVLEGSGDCARTSGRRQRLPVPQFGGAAGPEGGRQSGSGNEGRDPTEDWLGHTGSAERRLVGAGSFGEHDLGSSDAFPPHFRRHDAHVSGCGPAGRDAGEDAAPSGSATGKKPDRRVRELLGVALGGGHVKATARPQHPHEYALPLHVKQVPRLSWEACDQVIAPSLRAPWEHAKRCLLDVPFVVAALGAYKPTPSIADLAPGDLERLLAFGYVGRVPPDVTPIATVRVFTVLEKMGPNGYTRRRFLAVPDAHNAALLDPGEISLPTVENVIADIALETARTGDFVAFYTQFPLPQSARHLYTFVAHDGAELAAFQCCTICTGQRQCPSLGQALTQSLVIAACAPGVRGQAYIDNVRFAGSPVAVDTSWVAFLDSVARLGLAFESLTAGPSYDFLGVRCSHPVPQRSPSSAATEKAVAKLRARADFCFAGPCSLRALLRLLGSLMWVSRVAVVPLCRFYACFKNIRRKCSTTAFDELDDQSGAMWPSTAQTWRAWVAAAARNEERTLAGPTRLTTAMFTDASLDGWAAVCIRDHPPGVSISFAPWPGALRNEHVNVLGSFAFLFGCQRLPEARPHERLLVFVDNTSVVCSAAKGYSSNFAMNFANGRALAHAQGFEVRDVVWVGTLSNLADHFTRINGLSGEILIATKNF